MFDLGHAAWHMLCPQTGLHTRYERTTTTECSVAVCAVANQVLKWLSCCCVLCGYPGVVLAAACICALPQGVYRR
jgi:hypothetical protein